MARPSARNNSLISLANWAAREGKAPLDNDFDPRIIRGLRKKFGSSPEPVFFNGLVELGLQMKNHRIALFTPEAPDKTGAVPQERPVNYNLAVLYRGISEDSEHELDAVKDRARDRGIAFEIALPLARVFELLRQPEPEVADRSYLITADAPPEVYIPFN